MALEELIIQLGVGGAAILALWKTNENTINLTKETITSNTNAIRRNTEILEKTGSAVTALKSYLEERNSRIDKEFEELATLMEEERKTGVQQIQDELRKRKRR